MSPGKFIYPNIVKVVKVSHLCCSDIILLYMWHHMDHPVIRVVPAQGFVAVLGNSVLTHFGHAVSKVHHLFSDITSSGGTVTSCVMLQLCTCTGHMTFCYKRSADASFEALGALLALGSWPLVRPFIRFALATHSWCLMCVGRNASSTSLGWSLLPSSVIIVLALVNSAVSPKGT